MSWQSAYVDLQLALTNAPSNSEVWVANGGYIPGPGASNFFQLRPLVELYGGFEGADSVNFPGGETELGQRNADPETNGTVLSGDIEGNDTGGTIIGTNSQIIVKGAVGPDSATARLDGFTLSGATSTAIENTNSSPRYHNLLITGNQSFSLDGIGMRNTNSSPDVRDCIFRENHTTNGIAAAMSNGGTSSPIVTDCLFESNSALGGGGAVGNFEFGAPQFTGCTFVSNSLTGFASGGAMECAAIGPIRLRGCTFVDNETPMNGGALAATSGETIVIDATFTNNRSLVGLAVNGGGAVYATGPVDVRLINCRFLSNEAIDAWGGGVLVDKAGVVELTNCLFSGNEAHRGGGFASHDMPVTLVNSTFSANAAAQDGGGIFVDNTNPLPGGADINAISTILWANTGLPILPVEQQQVAFVGRPPSPSVTFSCIQDNVPGDGNVPFGGAANGNIDLNPMFIDADGYDRTIGTEDDNLRLKSCSPAIDAADTPQTPADDQNVDQDGDTSEKTPDLDIRRRDINDPNSADSGIDDPPFTFVDMGGFEYQLRGDTNGNGIVNGGDIQSFTNCMTAGNPPEGGCNAADMNTDGVLNDFDTDCFVRVLLGYPSCIPTCGEAAQSGGGAGEGAAEMAAPIGEPGLDAPFNDCDGDGIDDAEAIATGLVPDCNGGGMPDACNMAMAISTSYDCNDNGIPDECEIAGCPAGDASCADCNGNGFLDACEIAAGIASDANEDGVLDSCHDGSEPAPSGEVSIEALLAFYDWTLQQTWGPDSASTGFEQFELLINELEALGLPIANPWLMSGE